VKEDREGTIGAVSECEDREIMMLDVFAESVVGDSEVFSDCLKANNNFSALGLDHDRVAFAKP